MSVFPISGNQNYTKIYDTVVTSSAVYNALLKSQGPIGIQTRIGTVTFTQFASSGAVDDIFIVKDLNGNNMQFQPGDTILSSTLIGHNTLVSTPGSIAEVELQLQEFNDTITPGTILTLGNSGDLSLVNPGQTVAVPVIVDGVSTYLSVAQSVEDIIEGTLDVRLNVIPLQL